MIFHFNRGAAEKVFMITKPNIPFKVKGDDSVGKYLVIYYIILNPCLLQHGLTID